MWGGKSFGDWVWNVAFDGIGSTAIATLAAVLFVLRQLRADRDLAWHEAFAQDVRQMVVNTEVLEQVFMSIIGSRPPAMEDAFTFQRWSTQLLNVAGRLNGHDERMRDLLRAAQATVVTAATFEGQVENWKLVPVINALGPVKVLLESYLRSPGTPSSWTTAEYARRLHSVRHGELTSW